MKKMIFCNVLFCFLMVNAHSQKPQIPHSSTVVNKQDTAYLTGRLGPSLISIESLIDNGSWLVVNNVLITEKKQISYFFEKYKTQYSGFKYYDEKEGLKKLGIESKNGILYCRVKHGVVNLE